MFVRSAWFCLTLAIGVSSSQASVADDCPNLTTSQQAKSYLNMQRDSPRIFTNCISGQLDSLPTSGTDLDKWEDFYRQTADIFRMLQEKEALGTSARASYSKDELELRGIYRQTLASHIADSKSFPDSVLKGLQTKYAVGVESEFDLILRRTKEGLATMEQAHELLVGLDPTHILDQTGAKWADMVRTCPAWKPDDGLTPMANWCQSGCPAEFQKVTIKLTEWMAGKPALGTASTMAMLKKQNADIVKSCKE